MASAEENGVRVFCRVRPGAVGATSAFRVAAPEIALAGEHEHRFRFDNVFDGRTTQDEVFRSVGEPLCEDVLAGFNCTVLAYGQTGAGKSFTIFGAEPPAAGEGKPGEASAALPVGSFAPDCDLRGLLPRTLERLFAMMRAQRVRKKHGTFLCKGSMVELYNEKVYDLLEPSPAVLQLRESISRGVYVEGQCEVVLETAEEALSCVVRGAEARRVGSTAMNRESSRSHTVFTLQVESIEEDADGIVISRSARLNVVDLAGSERQKLTEATGERQKEANYINKSLLCLGSVISALSAVGGAAVRPHIPFRDSKLTFLLRDSLGGNSKTHMIANVSDQPRFLAESLSTLKFAQRAKLIRNKAKVNEDLSSVNVVTLKAQIASLKEMLAAQQLAAQQLAPAHAPAVPQAAPNAPPSPSQADPERLEQLLSHSLSVAEAARQRADGLQSVADAKGELCAKVSKALSSQKLLLKMKSAQVSDQMGKAAPDALAAWREHEKEIAAESKALNVEAAEWRAKYDEATAALQLAKASAAAAAETESMNRKLCEETRALLECKRELQDMLAASTAAAAVAQEELAQLRSASAAAAAAAAVEQAATASAAGAVAADRLAAAPPSPLAVASSVRKRSLHAVAAASDDEDEQNEVGGSAALFMDVFQSPPPLAVRRMSRRSSTEGQQQQQAEVPGLRTPARVTREEFDRVELQLTARRLERRARELELQEAEQVLRFSLDASAARVEELESELAAACAARAAAEAEVLRSTAAAAAAAAEAAGVKAAEQAAEREASQLRTTLEATLARAAALEAEVSAAAGESAELRASAGPREEALAAALAGVAALEGEASAGAAARAQESELQDELQAEVESLSTLSRAQQQTDALRIRGLRASEATLRQKLADAEARLAEGEAARAQAADAAARETAIAQAAVQELRVAVEREHAARLEARAEAAAAHEEARELEGAREMASAEAEMHRQALARSTSEVARLHEAQRARERQLISELEQLRAQQTSLLEQREREQMEEAEREQLLQGAAGKHDDLPGAVAQEDAALARVEDGQGAAAAAAATAAAQLLNEDSEAYAELGCLAAPRKAPTTRTSLGGTVTILYSPPALVRATTSSAALLDLQKQEAAAKRLLEVERALRFEAESRVVELQIRVEELAAANSKLAGNANLRQKIRYVEQLKSHIAELERKNAALKHRTMAKVDLSDVASATGADENDAAAANSAAGEWQ
jgi:kinesin family protein 15